MWVLAALVMLIPILMIVLNLTLAYPAIRWVNLVAAVFLVLFNVAGLPYPRDLRQLPDRRRLRAQRLDSLVRMDLDVRPHGVIRL